MNIIETNLSFRTMTNRSQTNRIILHHADASTFSPYQVHQLHLQNGWAGAGYHFYVRKDGTVYRLRPEQAVGSHALNNNFDSIGVCFEGDFDVEIMPDAQKKSGKEIVAWLKGKYRINKVQKHSDVNNTACPGNKFPFAEISGASGNVDITTSEPSKGDNKNWISNLQSECNRQGFSSQVVDGIAGKNTLAGCPMMKKGASGNITKILQSRLNQLGYSCGSIDGIFGVNTKAAVIKYQKVQGLSADGIVGVNTWAKLLGL